MAVIFNTIKFKGIGNMDIYSKGLRNDGGVDIDFNKVIPDLTENPEYSGNENLAAGARYTKIVSPDEINFQTRFDVPQEVFVKLSETNPGKNLIFDSKVLIQSLSKGSASGTYLNGKRKELIVDGELVEEDNEELKKADQILKEYLNQTIFPAGNFKIDKSVQFRYLDYLTGEPRIHFDIILANDNLNDSYNIEEYLSVEGLKVCTKQYRATWYLMENYVEASLLLFSPINEYFMLEYPIQLSHEAQTDFSNSVREVIKNDYHQTLEEFTDGDYKET